MKSYNKFQLYLNIFIKINCKILSLSFGKNTLWRATSQAAHFEPCSLGINVNKHTQRRFLLISRLMSAQLSNRCNLLERFHLQQQERHEGMQLDAVAFDRVLQRSQARVVVLNMQRGESAPSQLPHQCRASCLPSDAATTESLQRVSSCEKNGLSVARSYQTATVPLWGSEAVERNPLMP